MGIMELWAKEDWVLDLKAADLLSGGGGKEINVLYSSRSSETKQ